MKAWKKIKQADAKASLIYEKLSKLLAFRIITKLAGEIVLACFVAFAVYVATGIYNDMRVVSQENKKIDNVYISVSDDYVESLFGIPIVSEEDSNHLINKFYLLDDAVLRTVSKDDSVIAFFVTSKKRSRKIPVSSYNNKTVKIGSITYAKNCEYNEKLHTDYFISGQGRINYYCEFFYTGRSRMYNIYIMGTVAYGFNDQNAKDLLLDTRDNPIESNIITLRKKARPNTYGVIANGYENMVSIIPQGEFSSGSWLDMYYLINN